MKALLSLLAFAAPILAPAALINQLTFGSHVYSLYAGGVDNATYATATTKAQSLGGYLARIDDASENLAVFNFLAANNASITQAAGDGGGARYVWLGGDDLAVEGTWRWQNNTDAFYVGTGGAGAPAGGRYNNFGVGAFTQEPDDFMSAQDGLGMAMDDWPAPSGIGGNAAGKWNDISAANTMAFVVEVAVPEPSASALLALGLLLLRRRR